MFMFGKNHKKINEKFEKLMTQYGLFLVNAYCYAADGGESGFNDSHPENQISGPLIENKEITETLMSASYDSRQLFRWLVPDTNGIGFRDNELLPRPKSVRPHKFNYVEKFSNNTVVHGLLGEDNEPRYFFATCINNIVTTYTTQWDGHMYIMKHKLANANKVWRILETALMNDVPQSEFEIIFSEFFGTKILEGYPPIVKPCRLYEHSFLLPDPEMLIQYLDRLIHFMNYEKDKDVIRKAQKLLY